MADGPSAACGAQQPPGRSEPEHPEARLGDRRVERRADAEREDGARVRGRIDVERKERPSGAAGNANRNGYSRRVVLRSSVNVIANPVRVAPIPKVIAHVPTNIVITTSGVELSLIKVAMPNAVM